MGSGPAQAHFQSPEMAHLLQQCIHCGLCLQACPTYMVFGTETDSPRGRISLIRAASEGRIGLEGAFQEHIDLCLACRACETACPSGVQYGALVETARIAIEQNRRPAWPERLARWLALRQLMPHVGRLKVIARLGLLYQAVGLSRLVRALDFLPGPLKTLEGMLPPLPARYPDYRRPAPARGPRRGKVAFFYGCVQEAFLADVNAATVRVLQENGYDVHFPPQQTCCGAAQLHLGELELTLKLARQNIDALLDAGSEPYTAIINNAGGCGAALKEYAHLLKDDPLYAEKARRFVGKVEDISEFLVEQGWAPPRGEVRARITYSDSCHLRHAQRVIQQPRDLLRAIPGIELVELSRPDLCCGSAGVYNLVQTEAANAILDQKMQDIAATRADLIVAANTGCYFQLLYGARRAGYRARVVHLVELLDQSYQAARSA
ncbi:MAG TPA: heterodisulfide reductase-related iron-sulfur binding cluster [Anaerolineales bacterium]